MFPLFHCLLAFLEVFYASSGVATLVLFSSRFSTCSTNPQKRHFGDHMLAGWMQNHLSDTSSRAALRVTESRHGYLIPSCIGARHTRNYFVSGQIPYTGIQLVPSNPPASARCLGSGGAGGSQTWPRISLRARIGFFGVKVSLPQLKAEVLRLEHDNELLVSLSRSGGAKAL